MAALIYYDIYFTKYTGLNPRDISPQYLDTVLDMYIKDDSKVRNRMKSERVVKAFKDRYYYGKSISFIISEYSNYVATTELKKLCQYIKVHYNHIYEDDIDIHAPGSIQLLNLPARLSTRIIPVLGKKFKDASIVDFIELYRNKKIYSIKNVGVASLAAGRNKIFDICGVDVWQFNKN